MLLVFFLLTKSLLFASCHKLACLFQNRSHFQNERNVRQVLLIDKLANKYIVPLFNGRLFQRIDQ